LTRKLLSFTAHIVYGIHHCLKGTVRHSQEEAHKPLGSNVKKQ